MRAALAEQEESVDEANWALGKHISGFIERVGTGWNNRFNEVVNVSNDGIMATYTILYNDGEDVGSTILVPWYVLELDLDAAVRRFNLEEAEKEKKLHEAFNAKQAKDREDAEYQKYLELKQKYDNTKK